jgi:hypothetical protein
MFALMDGLGWLRSDFTADKVGVLELGGPNLKYSVQETVLIVITAATLGQGTPLRGGSRFIALAGPMCVIKAWYA